MNVMWESKVVTSHVRPKIGCTDRWIQFGYSLHRTIASKADLNNTGEKMKQQFQDHLDREF